MFRIVEGDIADDLALMQVHAEDVQPGPALATVKENRPLPVLQRKGDIHFLG